MMSEKNITVSCQLNAKAEFLHTSFFPFVSVSVISAKKKNSLWAN